MASNLPTGGTDEQFPGSAVEMVPGNAAILDAEGTIVSTTSAWEEVAEATDDWLHPAGLGVNYLQVLDAAEETSATHVAAGLRALLQGDRERFEFSHPSTDEPQWVLTRATTFMHDGDRYLTVTHCETTASKNGQRVLSKACEVATAPDRSFDEKVDTLLALGRATIGIDYATLSRVHDDEYVFEAVAGPADVDFQGATVPLDELPVCERVVERERTLVIGDVEAHSPELADSEWGIASYLGAPVTVHGEVYGTFCFYSMDPRAEAFSEWAVTFVECLSNWVGHELERRACEEQLQQLKENITDVVWMSSPEKDEIEFISDAYEDVWGRSPETLLAEPTSFVDAIHPDDRVRVREALAEQQHHPDRYEETYRIVQPDGEVRWIHDRASGIYDDNDTLRSIVGIASDITDRKKRERALTQQRDELAQLQRLNTLVRSITQALQDTSTRDAIETAVCNRLTESNLYQTVWIGTRSESATGDPVIVPQTGAGVDESYFDHIPGSERGPARTALRSGEVQVIDDIATASEFPDDRRETALTHDHHALAAVPVTTDRTTYGVLVVYAPRGHTIGDAEQEVLGDLGRSIALAIQRVHSQRSLTAETAVTLDLRLPDTDLDFAEVSSTLGCDITFERRIPTSDGRTIYYLTVHGTDPIRVCEKLEDGRLVAACTVVRDAGHAEPALIEAHLEGTPRLPLDVLTDYGASVTTARAVDGDISLSVELPPGVDVQTVLTDLHEIVPAIKVVSKRHVDRQTKTVTAIQEQIKAQLTPKQEAALKAAYVRGYYRWPRDSTVEDLADTFDLSASTLHYRLRKAHHTVITALLDGERK